LTIRVFIADDHGVLRGGLRAFIGAQPDMEVVGEAANGLDAANGIQQSEPHVALMDIGMPGGGGLAAIATVKRIRPNTQILVLTGYDQSGYVRAAMDAGATGYVVKNAVDTELLAAIRSVAQGRTFVDSSLKEGLAQPSTESRRATTTDSRDKAHLTERELEVLGRVAEGYTNSEIAEELRVGTKSIETYRSRVMEKLGLTTRSDLVRFALEYGILVPGKPTQ
jgi:two-component system response regulator NreC